MNLVQWILHKIQDHFTQYHLGLQLDLCIFVALSVLSVDGGLALYGTVGTEIRFCKVETWWTLLVFADEQKATSHDGVHNLRGSFCSGAPHIRKRIQPAGSGEYSHVCKQLFWQICTQGQSGFYPVTNLCSLCPVTRVALQVFSWISCHLKIRNRNKIQNQNVIREWQPRSTIFTHFSKDANCEVCLRTKMSDMPESLQEFRENLIDDRVPWRRDSHASSSLEPSLELTPKRSVDLVKHSVYFSLPWGPKLRDLSEDQNYKSAVQKTHRHSRSSGRKFWWLDKSRSQSSQWRL